MTNLEWLKTLDAGKMALELLLRKDKICARTGKKNCIVACPRCIMNWLKKERYGKQEHKEESNAEIC